MLGIKAQSSQATNYTGTHTAFFAKKSNTKMEHVRSELRNTNGNTNSIWKIINQVIPNKNSSSLMTVEDFYVLANNFNEFYTNVGPTEAKKASALASEHGLIFHDDINQHLTSISDEDSAKFRFHSVTEEDVSKIIKNLPSNKAPGYDKVTARVLKANSPVTVPIIANLINGSFSHNTFPNAWKMAEVIPIQKSGDYKDPANTHLYRYCLLFLKYAKDLHSLNLEIS